MKKLTITIYRQICHSVDWSIPRWNQRPIKVRKCAAFPLFWDIVTLMHRQNIFTSTDLSDARILRNLQLCFSCGSTEPKEFDSVTTSHHSAELSYKNQQTMQPQLASEILLWHSRQSRASHLCPTNKRQCQPGRWNKALVYLLQIYLYKMSLNTNVGRRQCWWIVSNTY